MSFRFNPESFRDNSFNEEIRAKLTKALNSSSGSSTPTMVETASSEKGAVQGAKMAAVSNSGSLGAATDSESTMRSRKLDILKSDIIVSKVNFPTMPKLEILDLDISAQPRSLVKGICKISCMDAMLQIQTEIEGNLLLVYSEYSPEFTTPTLNCKGSFTIPITMVFSGVQLEAITNIFVKNSGIGISFNDVNLDFDFNCSIKILQSTIEKRLKKSMQSLFKDVLPKVIFNMSQSLFTAETGSSRPTEAASGDEEAYSSSTAPKVILEETDMQELSAANMLRLSTLISSRQTLSLQATVLNVPSTIPGCLERQNLHRFNSRIPSLSNYYAAYKDPERHAALMKRTSSTLAIHPPSSLRSENLLPERVLQENAYDLKTIASIQSRIFDRGADDNVRPRRRKLTLKRKKKSKEEVPTEAPDSGISSGTDTFVGSPEPTTPVAEDANQPTTETSSIPANTMLSLKLPTSIRPNYLTRLERTLLPLETGREKATASINPLEEPGFSPYRPELHRLHSSLYSPLSRHGSMLISSKELSEPKQLLDPKGLNLLCLNRHARKWGNEEEPPPYQI
ncbi:hypothetical protein HG536_0D05590 [Torulaspora globosa]|uniref:Mitochondrial distribution and morphology protein 34 n=1 Tax=Torulaspora globosa TaxID=48254 RepID=A0A7G3ZHQ2_9SACH|nr:uncharacterized protein HG536_0D05590 [Torulaspora globosa]QLL33038.1 hypothetical protein HG536_0D05590 [Torulaspora globosa]